MILSTPPSRVHPTRWHRTICTAVFRYVCVAAGMEVALTTRMWKRRLCRARMGFPACGLRRFLGWINENQQLKELASIVLGIRIFNRSIGKGGRRLDDPAPGYLSQASKLREDLGGKLMSTERLLGQYASVVAFKSQSTRPGDPLMTRLRDETTNRQAYAAALRRLIDGCSKGAAAVASLADQLAREVGAVQSLVGAKNSVPKEKVYPRLDALGALHMALVEERRAQVVLQRVTDTLVDFAKPFKTTTNQMLHERRRRRRIQCRSSARRCGTTSVRTPSRRRRRRAQRSWTEA